MKAFDTASGQLEHARCEQAKQAENSAPQNGALTAAADEAATDGGPEGAWWAPRAALLGPRRPSVARVAGCGVRGPADCPRRS